MPVHPRRVVVFTMSLALIGAALITVFITERANAGICSGESPAMSIDWGDNWWVGKDNDGSPNCDTAGQYVVTIQRINRGHGYDASSVDGYYGPNTQDDVEDFQSAHGLTADGLVGNNTWNQYDTHPTDMDCETPPLTDCYWYYPAYSGTPLWYQFSSFNQMCAVKLGTGWDYVWFDRTGPSGTNSC